MGIATWLLVALTLLFQLGASGQVHPAEEENINSAELTPSFRASKLLIPQKTISKLTTKASSRPITTTKRIGQTTKPIKNQQLQKTTPKKILVQHIHSKAKSFTTTKKLAQLKTTTEPEILVFPAGALYSLDTPTEDPQSFPPEKVFLSVAAEVNEDYDNLNETESTTHNDDHANGLVLSTTLNTTDASTVEDVTRKRLKRRKTTTSDPAIQTTRRRLKRTRTTTVGSEDA